MSVDDPHPLATALIEGSRRRYGWDDERQRLAERFQQAFGGNDFWQSSAAGKEARCREVAQELLDLVGAPLGAPAELDWWTELLRRRFAHMGFWQASKRWKQYAYEEVVREVYLAKRLVAGSLDDPRLSAPGGPAEDGLGL